MMRFTKMLCVVLASMVFFAAYLCLAAPGASRVAVLLVDTNHVTGTIEKPIYGQFLEHINHSVVDGLYAEQIRGQGFEGKDFQTYWKTFANHGTVQIVHVKFKNGDKSVRIEVNDGAAGIRQGRIYVQAGYQYDGYVWLKPEGGTAKVTLRMTGSDGKLVAEAPLPTSGSAWQKVPYHFSSATTDGEATFEIEASGTGSVLVDFVSLMRADARKNGMVRPDLVEALRGLKPPFIRWPGGSFASIYKWEDGIGPQVSRGYHPNTIWGGYSDYYGFGTDEFMELCRRLHTQPLIDLAATSTDPKMVQYAMDWVHYLNDPPTTKWGRMRAANGHTKPYGVNYFEIDNEPMNHGLTPEQYAKIVNVYGSRLRKIAPKAKIVASGQKRSNDMIWSEKIINLAGSNFDILDVHNYEYENQNYQTGLLRVQDYLVKLRDYIRASKHPQIKIGVLEWGLCRTADWRAGLHAAGSLILYEKLSPAVAYSSPALLMRNTADNPLWHAWIYHNHMTWFPGSGYVVEKLFRDHYEPERFASTTGTFRDIPNRKTFFDDIAQMIPEGWQAGTVDAIATGSADRKHIVIKAVNYEGRPNILLTRLQGSSAPTHAQVKIFTLKAGLMDAPSLEDPDKIEPVETTMPYAHDLTINLAPDSVTVVAIDAK